ncbi:MAG: class I SAM-dependent methyltransferase [Candidatus Lokiarchaeota archaeon]|nr:class I SAM-dependent methyltransferase [Candidatus Lokiarchaeota archaeon]
MQPIKFTKVQESILFSVYARALYSINPNNKFKDVEAEHLISLLNVDIKDLENRFDEITQIGCATRAITVDYILKNFIESHPLATIINIGAGLDTTFIRVDNGSIRWYDLDLQEGIEFRKKYLKDSERNKSIGKSMFDYTWMNDIEFDPIKGIFLFAVGVFPYLTFSQVKKFFQIIPDVFPGGEFLFDTVSEKGMNLINKKIANLREKEEEFDLEVLSYINEIEDLSRFSDKIMMIDEFSYFNKISQVYDEQLNINNNVFFNSKLKLTKFIHIKFKK